MLIKNDDREVVGSIIAQALYTPFTQNDAFFHIRSSYLRPFLIFHYSFDCKL